MHTNRYKKGLVLSVAGALIAGSVGFLMQSSDMLMASIKITPKVKTSDVLKLEPQKLEEFLDKSQIALPTSIPDITKLPRLGDPISQPIEGPRLETRSLQAFASARNVRPGEAVTIFAKLLEGTVSAAPVSLRAAITSGDGMLNTQGFVGYNINAATSAITMDRICYYPDTIDEYPPNDYLLFHPAAQIFIEPRCSSSNHSSGWYIAKFYAPLSVTRDQLNTIAISVDGDYPLEEQVDIVVSDAPTLRASNVEVYKLQDTYEGTQDMPVIITVTDPNGYGISCEESTATGAMITWTGHAYANGCNEHRNGYRLEQSLTINSSVEPDSFLAPGGALKVDIPLFTPAAPERATMQNMRAYSRGNEVDIKGISGFQGILTNLGGGAYFMLGRANTFANGTADFRVELQGINAITRAPITTQILVRHNVVPYSLRLGLTMTLPTGLLPRIEL